MIDFLVEEGSEFFNYLPDSPDSFLYLYAGYAKWYIISFVIIFMIIITLGIFSKMRSTF